MSDVPCTPMHTVLVANRGEIAVRVVRACRDAGLASVACYADSDEGAPHTLLADRAFRLPGSTAVETYLRAEALLAVAKESGADAVHPGYGFLSEDANFAQAVLDAGLIWIGPSPAAMRTLGDKVSARRIAQLVGAPMAAGTPGPVTDITEIERFAAEHGLPIAIKAAFGGGGRGLKVVLRVEDIPSAFESAVREAQAAFGRGECFVERYLPRARHLEAQVLADQYGTVVVVGTRDCSLQRRHQKLVEEAPAPFLTEAQRIGIQESAAAICREAGYYGAGTVEYLLGEDGTVSFLEVNTRLQVEHPVTEETSGVDLVIQQLRIAAGKPLSLPDDLCAKGHSIEFRINAEDPDRDFLPSPGKITRFDLPLGPGIRVDSGVATGTVVGGQFDSLLAKLVVTGRDRQHALSRARHALAEMQVDGPDTVLPFHREVVDHPDFIGDANGFAVHTRWIEDEYQPARTAAGTDDQVPSSVPVRLGSRSLHVSLPGLALLEGASAESVLSSIRAQAATGSGSVRGEMLVSPMQGTVIQVAVQEGQEVAADEVVVVVEAMKMENPVRSHTAGVVRDLAVKIGDSVPQDAVLCRVTAAE